MDLRIFLSWKSLLVAMAIIIVGTSLLYTSHLASKLAIEERKKVKLFAEGIKSIATAQNDEEISFATNIVTQDSSIPRIITDQYDHIQDIKAIDTSGKQDGQKFLKEKIAQFKKINPPILVDFGSGVVLIYYGESFLLTRLRYFPYAQLAIITIFLIVVIISIGAANKSIQNQVWAGLSKETAHQLGTPISSIEGWIELLKEEQNANTYVIEMQKDVERLKLVADRFSKVGSAPQLNIENIVPRLNEMVHYMQKRAPAGVNISFKYETPIINAQLSGPIFDWVIENLIRNALDAMESKGNISIDLLTKGSDIIIDISDNGKGIAKHHIKKVFSPGFTTKKRGWGLGLSLSKRIIEKYHHGSIFVKQSELNKGTTFRILLAKA